MPLEKGQKIAIGIFVGIVIIFMISSSIFLSMLLSKQNSQYKIIEGEIENLRKDSQSQINELAKSVISAKDDLNTINTKLGTINKEFSELKASTSADFSGIIESSVKSVVAIRTDISQGSGFIITPDGYIVTNLHVLSGGKKIETITYEQKIIDTELIGYDENLDIALLKISGSYTNLELANSENTQIGEKVIAIGNPLGLQFSVSEGIVSGIHRTGSNNLEAYTQTDAALNPGNSGGPLVNKNGEVIGINNFKIGGSENLGFALESNYIKEAVNSISAKNLNQTLI